MKKTAVWCGSYNLMNAMLASAKSVIAHSDVNKVYVISDAEKGWTPKKSVPEIVEYIDGREYLGLFDEYGPNYKTRYSPVVLLRAAFPFIFQKLDRIVSFDADLVAVSDCSGIWEQDISDHYFAAAVEPERCYGGLIYTNTGVVHHNLALQRVMGKDDEIIDVLNRHWFNWVEQDAYNYLCQGRILEMPGKYNFNPWTVLDGETPVIHHYAGVKEDFWDEKPPFSTWSKTDWDHVMEMHRQTRKERRENA